MRLSFLYQQLPALDLLSLLPSHQRNPPPRLLVATATPKLLSWYGPAPSALNGPHANRAKWLAGTRQDGERCTAANCCEKGSSAASNSHGSLLPLSRRIQCMLMRPRLVHHIGWHRIVCTRRSQIEPFRASTDSKSPLLGSFKCMEGLRRRKLLKKHLMSQFLDWCEGACRSTVH